MVPELAVGVENPPIIYVCRSCSGFLAPKYIKVLARYIERKDPGECSACHTKTVELDECEKICEDLAFEMRVVEGLRMNKEIYGVESYYPPPATSEAWKLL